MSTEIKVWAYDILSAIQEIELFLEEVESFEVYQYDLKTRRAVERNLEVIGEAMNWILKKDPLAIFTDARKIVETRNRIIHGYDTVSDIIIWSIATDSLPGLKGEMERFLEE